MSATSQNFAYIYGAKKPGAKENVISKEEMARIVEDVTPLLNNPYKPKEDKK